MKNLKATAIAHSNIAFIKYWGKKDEKLHLPLNNSLSVNLDNLITKTTVEFSETFKKDQIFIDGQTVQGEKEKRVVDHLNRVRKMAKICLKAKVISKNNFPTASGLASSASGFAALSLASTKALGLSLSEKDLSILARLGSGSACRSIPDGFVEWYKGKDHQTSYAKGLFPPSYWSLSIIVLLIETKEKKTFSNQGHQLVWTSPFFKERLKNIDKKIFLIKKYLQEKNFLKFGQIVEDEALELHSIMLTSKPALIYWQPETIKAIKYIYFLREKGLPVFFTIDAGSNLFLISQKKDEKDLIRELKKEYSEKKIIINHPSKGAFLIKDYQVEGD